MEIKKKSPIYIGLGKTLFSSSVSILDLDESPFPITYLLERYTRKKADGSWPFQILSLLKSKFLGRELRISENRDVVKPSDFERMLDKSFPFYSFLEKNELSKYSSNTNDEVSFISHHYAHAQVAKYMSPFNKCAILVIDGAGSKAFDIDKDQLDYSIAKDVDSDSHEESSVYIFEEGRVSTLFKNWQTFKKSGSFPEHHYSNGLGTCYEKVAEFIFNSKRASGKVMGLAPFGKDLGYINSEELLDKLDWNYSFNGSSKSAWESSPHLQLYKDLACTVQRIFEERMESLLLKIKESSPGIDKLIIAGGCALNCTSNMKVLEKNIFSEIYIPPFPGDESIGLGCALHEYYKDNNWQVFTHEDQQGYFGEDRFYNKVEIEQVFSGYRVCWPESIQVFCANLIAKGEVIGWFQGKSESGPRALGNRSIISRMDIEGRKDYLNNNVKFRESFRPYGASVLFEDGAKYFNINKAFNNPYMSFAVEVKPEYREIFKEATHVDGTSRMQLLRRNQNSNYYDLINEVKRITGVGAVLNTSLNIMGEPIVETITDLKKFIDKSNVFGVAIGNAFIFKENIE